MTAEGEAGSPGRDSSQDDELPFDVVVIGAGTAGLAAAKAAHAEGARVAIVDPGPLGTFCARLGCMPSKALLQSTLALVRTRRSGALGVVLDGPPDLSGSSPASACDLSSSRLDWPTVRARKRALVDDFVAQVVRATTTSKSFTLLRGTAEFLDGRTLRVDGQRVDGPRMDGQRVVARRWILATGSSPVRPPIPGLDDIAALTLTSDDVFELESIPASVAVVGAGAVGTELGQFLARAGADVHLISRDDRIAGLRPGALQNALLASLERELTVHRAARIERVRREGDGVTIALENASEVHVDRLLLAAGRRPNLDALALARIDVRIVEGVPVHDEYLRTTNHAVFVAGDAAGAPALLHAATIQGRTAGWNAMHDTKLERPKLEPALRVVFCSPIVAAVGLDPEAAKGDGSARICVVTRPWAQQGKARIMDETEGLAQLVVDRTTRKLLGCQLVGPDADVLIHLASYAMHFGATVDDLVTLHHYHPTLAEMIPSLAQSAIAALDGVECTRGQVAAVVEMQ
jgi:dihydrolipoamide dehydrogenase